MSDSTLDRDRSRSPSRSGDESRPPQWRLSGGPFPAPSTSSSGVKNFHLSPAVSAFQFKSLGTPNKLGGSVMSRSFSNESRGASASIHAPEPMQRSASGFPPGASVPPGYFRTPPPVSSSLMNSEPPLDEKKIEELRKAEAIPLQNEWTFWLDKYVANLSPEQYAANLKPISTVGTVQAFWSVFNNIVGPDKLATRGSLHFMKKGIQPAWEDPQNENGGAYNFKIKNKDSMFAWRELLMMLIGEQFEDILSPGDSVCGVSVSIRPQADNFQIWTSRAESNNVEKVTGRLVEVLKPVEVINVFYKIHRNHAAFITTGKPDDKDKQTLETLGGGERPRFFNNRTEDATPAKPNGDGNLGEIANGVAGMGLVDLKPGEK